MKRLLLFIVIFMFTANIVVVSAQAGMCMPATNPATIEKTEGTAIPCHDAQPRQDNEQKPGSHCDGIWLCLHMGSAQPLMTQEKSAILLFSFNKSGTILDMAEKMPSRATAPPQRPPKSHILV